jgi:regulator of sigma E protease
VRFFGDLPDLVSPYPREPLTFVIERDGKRVEPITIVPDAVEESNPIETKERGVIGVTPAFAPALVAPVVPGAAGPLQPFDLVVRAGGKKVRHLIDLEQAIAAAACGPIDLDVVRERPVALPGASVSTAEQASLAGVPTCREGEPVIAPADRTLATYIASVVPGSPAEKAGLRRGDAIVAVNGTKVHTFMDIDALGAFRLPPPAAEGRDPAVPRRGDPVTLALRDGRTVTVTPTVDPYVDRLTKERLERPLVGFQPDRGALVDARELVVEKVELRRGLLEIATVAWNDLVEVVRLTVLGIARIVTGHISFKTVGGPIMLFSIASDAVDEGLGSFLFKMALISVNLGLMNLLPIPVLDGGHIAAAIVESVTRRPLSVRSREIANIVGLILLFTLMLFVFKNDISRLLG